MLHGNSMPKKLENTLIVHVELIVHVGTKVYREGGHVMMFFFSIGKYLSSTETY
jgi:hypothetical protein